MLIEELHPDFRIYNREKSTGFIIQILTEELDGGNVI